MKNPKISAVYLTLLLRELNGVDVSQSGILTRAIDKYERTRGRLSLEEFGAIYDEAIRVTGDKRLALKAARNCLPATFGLIGHIVSHCRTLPEALKYFVRFEHLINPLFQSDLTIAPGNTRLVIHSNGHDSRAVAALMELHCAAIYHLGNLLCEDGAKPARMKLVAVRFQHKALVDQKEYEQLFDCPVSFGQSCNEAVFDDSFLALNVCEPVTELLPILVNKAEMLNREYRGRSATADQVRNYIRSQLPGGRPNLQWAADYLGMSVSTLKKKLKFENAGYKTLFDEVLAEWAKDMLSSHRYSIARIARDLGYADSSGFHRAFKRWTGVSPVQYRKVTKVNADKSIVLEEPVWVPEK